MRQDEIGENYEEPHTQGAVIHDQQDRASAMRTEGDARVDGGGTREWQRARRAGLGSCGRCSKGIEMLQLRDDGTLREGL